ncbi:hypothetical protein RI367_000651 [Sorochytrium milnesiophthora]
MQDQNGIDLILIVLLPDADGQYKVCEENLSYVLVQPHSERVTMLFPDYQEEDVQSEMCSMLRRLLQSDAYDPATALTDDMDILLARNHVTPLDPNLLLPCDREENYGSVHSRSPSRVSSRLQPLESIQELSRPGTPMLPALVAAPILVEQAGMAPAKKQWFRRKELRPVVRLFALNISLSVVFSMSGSLLPQLVLLLAGFRLEDGKSESNIAAQKEATSLLTTMNIVTLFVGLWLLSAYSTLAARYNRMSLIRAACMGLCISSLLVGCAALQPSYAALRHTAVGPTAEPGLNVVIRALFWASSVVEGICGFGLYSVVGFAFMLESTPEADRSELIAHMAAFSFIASAIANTAAGYLATYLGLVTAQVISVGLSMLVCFASFLLGSPSAAAAAAAATSVAPPGAGEAAGAASESRLRFVLRTLNPFGCLSILVLPSRRRCPDLSRAELYSRRKRVKLLIAILTIMQVYHTAMGLFGDVFTPYITFVFHWTPLEIGSYNSALSVLSCVMLMLVVPVLTQRVARQNAHIFAPATVDPVEPEVEDLLICDPPAYPASPDSGHQDGCPSPSRSQYESSDSDSVFGDLTAHERTPLVLNKSSSDHAKPPPILPCATAELGWALFSGVVETLTFLIQAAAQTSGAFTTGAMIRTVGRMAYPMLSSVKSRLVPSSNIPQLVAAANLIGSAFGVIRPFCSNFIYQRTLETQPATVIFIAVGVAAMGCVLNLAVMLWVKYVNRRNLSDIEDEGSDC